MCLFAAAFDGRGTTDMRVRQQAAEAVTPGLSNLHADDSGESANACAGCLCECSRDQVHHGRESLLRASRVGLALTTTDLWCILRSTSITNGRENLPISISDHDLFLSVCRIVKYIPTFHATRHHSRPQSLVGFQDKCNILIIERLHCITVHFYSICHRSSCLVCIHDAVCVPHADLNLCECPTGQGLGFQR